ncbi:MAG TPA: hypothetical protein VK721_00300 [Solirubrobacteraceae bacterium]|nr:hypothetical protein [Solirubrobacteraceae bacterium]
MESGSQERVRTRSRMRQGGVCAALLSLALLLAIVPVSAAATPEDAASTHAYLLAINTFEAVELSNLTHDLAAREAVGEQISSECSGILTNAPPHEEAFGVGLVGPGSLSPPNARAEGERQRQSRQLDELELELTFALSVPRTQPEREAAETLVGAVTPLRWSNPKITFLLHFVVEVLKEELALPAPPVCTDMKAWVASGYKTLTPASREMASHSEGLLKRSFELIALAGQIHVRPFPEDLAPYESAEDRALARHQEQLAAQLRTGRDTQAAVLKRVQVAVGLPIAKTPKIKRPTRKPVVIARGRTASGARFVARAEPTSRSPGRGGCTVNITIAERSRQSEGIVELLSGEGTGRCLSRSHVDPEPAVHCKSGLLTIEANLLPATRSVRLLLSNGATLDSSAIRVPAHLGGPAGLYYQVVRGPSPIPVSLTELDAQGGTLSVLKLPAVVECTKNPVKYFPGGVVRLVHESSPQLPTFTISAERYRKLGAVHFELKLAVSHEELLFGGGNGGSFEGSVAVPRGWRVFQPQASSGCQPEPYVIIYGLLRTPRDTVLARVSGKLIPLREVAIPPHLHAGGALAYGAFSPLPTELLIRDASGRTIESASLAEAAKSATETCEGEAE